MTRRSPERYSMDGFMPSGQGRHVGFGDTRSPRPGSNASDRSVPGAAGQRVRMRRPGLHTLQALPTTNSSQPFEPMESSWGAKHNQPDVAKQPSAQDRHHSPQFTAYTSGSMSPGSGNKRNRASKFGGRSNQTGQADRPKKTAWIRRANWKKIFKRTFATAGVFLLLGGGWLGWQFFENSRKVFGGDASILGFLNASKLRGEDQGQVNILVAGVSTDDPGHAGAALTDSIMLISLDTKNKKASMLSIPRDLWVDIPGYGHAKINAANAYGDEDKFSQSGYPSGGMGLLAKVVANNFELPVHYYAKVNYSAFRDAVNAVGGIDVNITSSDRRGLYDPNIAKVDQGPLKLKNGLQKLDGQTALNLARARGDPTGDGRIAYGFERSDFTRTEHQRLMMLALKERVSSSSVISNPLKVGQLFDVVGKNLKTDFEPGEIRRLYDINKQTKSSDIVSISLNDVNGTNLLTSYRTADGASALIPAAGIDDFSNIQLTIKKLMSSDPVVKESAQIVILNGTDVTGLASKESNNVTSKGLNVVAVGDAPSQAGNDVIIDISTKNGQNGQTTKPGTKARLQQLFSGATIKTENTLGYPTADFIVILGTNHRMPASETEE